MLASDLLLLAQIFAIPLMKPAVSGRSSPPTCYSSCWS